MKAILSAMTLLFLTGSAMAIERYQISRMTCGEVKSVVNGDGAAILRWTSKRSGMPLYDRYVANGRFCAPGEVTSRASVPTQDLDSCPVLKCVPHETSRRRRLFLLDE